MTGPDRRWQNWTGDVRTRQDQSEGLTEPDRRWQNQKNKIEELADQTGEMTRQIQKDQTNRKYTLQRHQNGISWITERRLQIGISREDVTVTAPDRTWQDQQGWSRTGQEPAGTDRKPGRTEFKGAQV
jgi:hypothetical protein